MTLERHCRHWYRIKIVSQNRSFRWLPAVRRGKSAAVPIQTMTLERQESYLRGPGMALFALLAAVFALIGLDRAALGATTERIVVNRYSGLAIEGFDPVAYFTDAQAIRGLPDFEAPAAGAVWRFHN